MTAPSTPTSTPAPPATPAPTFFLPVRSYSTATPLDVDPPASETYGTRYPISSSDQRFVLTVKNCVVKPCVNEGSRFLVIPSPADAMLATLENVRTRCIEGLATMRGVDAKAMRPILTTGKGKFSNQTSLLLNLTPQAIIQDSSKKLVDYTTLPKTCNMALFIHVSSVYKNKKGEFSLQLKVVQMMVLEDSEVEEPQAKEHIDWEITGPIDNPADLL